MDGDLHTRPVPLGRSLNCRDVGGCATADGHRVRHGLLYRSDLPVLDDEHAADLEALGLRTVIDLREPEEQESHPSGLDGRVPHFVAMSFGLGPMVAADPSRAASLRTLYGASILHLGESIARVVTALCLPGALPALVHCTAGKDRTGMLVGLVLSAIGVADQDIARDYAATGANLSTAFFDRLKDPANNARVDLTSLEGSDADDMLHLLALVREKAGDAATYLVRNGVAPEDLDRLREALLAPQHA